MAVGRVSAQTYEISLAEKVRNSDLIVEGQVKQSRVFVDSKDDIYTIYTLSITAVLKGTTKSQEIEVINWGGETETEIQSWSHFLSLKNGDYGIFNLYHNINLPEIDKGNTYSIYSDSQGFFKFSDVAQGYISASDPYNTYRDIKKDCYDEIGKLTNQKISFLQNPNVIPIRSGIKYSFKDIFFDGKNIKFKIFVSSLIGEKKLYSSGLIMSYDINTYGKNIVGNNKILLENDGISDFPNYQLTKSDIADNQFKIELKSIGSETELITIGENEQLLLSGSLELQNIVLNPGVTFDIDNMYSLNTYYENSKTNIFNIIQVDANISAITWPLVPKITEIIPLSVSAGTDDIITIKGSGFGSTQGTSFVEFTNAFEGTTLGVKWIQAYPSDYKSWSDTEIKVRVPSISPIVAFIEYAGTGNIKVSVGNSTAVSKDVLTVRYAITNYEHNLPTTIPKYITKNRLVGIFGQDAGYTLYKALPGAVSSFERALCTWIESSNINFTIKDIKVATAPPPGNLYSKFACKITLTDVFPAGITNTTKALTSRDYSPDCTTNNIVYITMLRKFDILFRKSSTWFTQKDYDPPSDPTYWEKNIDLESVALHELGHAQQLQHTNNDDVMFWLIQKPRRKLGVNDVEGSNYMKNLNTSTLAQQCNAYTPIKLLTKCISTPTTEISYDSSINIFPNPTDGLLHVECENVIESVMISTILGEIIIDNKNVDSIFHQSINTEKLSSGLYCVKVKSNIGYSSFKFVKL